jgi:hypothetical protein
MPKESKPVLAVDVVSQIRVVRGQRVLLDSDLALLYGVSARRLNEQIRRNAERFPEGFIFTLTNQEATNLKSQNATSSWGGKRKSPLVFSEHGAIMAATVLNSPRAIQMTIYVVWNCTYISNSAFGYEPPLISTPQELVEE